MGITDTTLHSFRCPKCGAEESIKVLEKGSSYGASWMDAPEAKRFVVTWKRRGREEPQPESITCKECGSPGHDSVS